MQESPFIKFLDLINLDQRIESFNKECAQYAKQLQALQEDEQRQQALTDAFKKESMQAQKVVDAHELEMKTLDGAEKDKKHRLENVANHKEYQSIKQELDQIKKKQHSLEDELLEAWRILESRQHDYAAQERVRAQAHEQYVEQSTALDQHYQTSKSSMHELVAQRADKEKDVPAEWLEKYTMMRAQVTDPVVPVVSGSCGACFYKVNEQDLMLLKHKKLLQCKDCYRFLYLEVPSVPDETA